MHRILLACYLVSVFFVGTASAQFGGPDANWQEGWISLGASHPDFGWQTVGEATWTADENVVGCDGKPGWLFTTTRWANFELEADYRCLDANANSGFFIRSALEPTDPTQDCYEVNIAPADNPYPTGSLVGRQRASDDELPTDQAVKEHVVHHLRIVAEGPHMQVYLDGKLVTDYTDPSPLDSGFIGLQSKSGRVEFTNVRLRPLGTESIFNGRDLAGWKTDLAGPASISVTDEGEMQILGGSGQVESEGEYGNFVLQLECQVNGDGANSGVFFRSIPGDKMNGYECQIQNSYLDGDRTRPKDCGTGGIYRRVNARLVNANDHEWFSVTVNADGPHIATWVNGIQVVDWTDTREPDANPRSGLRLAPGTFCLQAHDPTTDLLFRHLRVEELP